MPELDTIAQTAERILNADPDPVVRFRLLRDVLNHPPDTKQLQEAGERLETSRWVRQLGDEQWSDGSWGRLHSRDSGARQKIPNTEAGVERALALGLDADHPVLRRASRYIVCVLDGTIKLRDRAEKNDRWPTGWRLFAASTLAQIQPHHPVLDSIWELWLTVARRTFASGAYDLQAEIRCHRELTGASVADSYLALNNKYTITLLGSRADALPRDLEAALFDWVWHNEGGVRYLGETPGIVPGSLQAAKLDRWLRCLELLSSFPSWGCRAQGAIRWLWEQQAGDGLWDFGRAANSVCLPLSESWHRHTARPFDWTTRVLHLLRRYHRREDEPLGILVCVNNGDD